MYTSKSSWLEHESNSHRRVWRCFEHKDLFKSRHALISHYEHAHSNLSKVQMQSMSELAGVGTKDERVFCPFCQSSGPFEMTLADHMALHMERLATFAAPRKSSERDHDSVHRSNSTAANGARSMSSLRSVSLNFSVAESREDDVLKHEDDGEKLDDREQRSLQAAKADEDAHKKLIAQKLPNSCGWFFDSPEFFTWLNYAGQNLFAYGPPGAGKSVLSSAVVEFLQQEILVSKDVYIVVIFGEAHEEETSKGIYKGLYWSILKQLDWASWAQNIGKDLLDHRKDKDWPDLDTVFNALIEASKRSPRVFVILDGIESMGSLRSLYSRFSASRVNFLITSTHKIPIKGNNTISLEVRASDDDILNYAKSLMEAEGLLVEVVLGMEDPIVGFSQGM
ncbi:hypothetical protein CkaCkLH20_00146 [Colletotrichum karsti]|uniref:AAA+ ATPase domain-containing protein n=1 Tax=Colletotrichum karsti TaxID=1095194 RepID=A0A9P6IG27_9PEZI|nr:uncharacterized protein CkaCkLH20_00146 [Colletotrichum karsti]KAF9882110.1 hypothetical protein CkaCkLH20_00146 [Colletotrichum karsti]